MTHVYNLPGFRVEVNPTMEVLGDQPFRCRVYPVRLGHMAFFQGLMVEASHPYSAALDAVEEFSKLYPDSPTCATCKHFRTYEVEDMDGFRKSKSFCHATSNFAERLPFYTCKRHATKTR